MSRDVSRRDLLRAGGAGALGYATLGLGGAGAQGRARMNVVVVVMDSLRADHVYGHRARTAAWDRVARQGVRFLNAHPEGMPTIPARRAIMSGKRTYPFRGWRPRWRDLPAQPGWEPVGSDGEMWTATLGRAGWTTGYVTDNPHLLLPVHARFRKKFDRVELVEGQVPVRRRPPGRPPGRVTAHYLPKALRGTNADNRMANYLALNPRNRPEAQYNAAKVFREAADMLGQAAKQRPFALVIDTFEPHEPWTPPRKYVDMYGDPDYRGPEPAKPYYASVSRYLRGTTGAVLLDRMKALYAAEVTMTDRWLGVFLDKLHALRLERDTIVVLVSDHGIYLGDHGMTGKSSITLHPQLIRVPLIVVDPRGRRAGRTSSWFASTHDIAPTILSMAGLPVPRKMDGVDLSRFFEGRRPPPRPYAWGGYGNSYFVRTDRWALHGPNRGDLFHLYDLREDPGETADVAAIHPDKVAELHEVVRERAGRPLPSYAF